MEHKSTVLVTGVGAIIGYGIVNSLRQSKYKCNIIGTDIYEDAVGRLWCDQFVTGVRADSEEFEDFILRTIQDFKIDLIIPSIEQDIQKLDNMRQTISEPGVALALNTPSCLYTFASKWRTSTLLKAHNLPNLKTLQAKYADQSQVLETLGLPCLAKLDGSYAGKGQQVLHNEHELQQFLGNEHYLLQQYVHGENVKEYTASVFGLGNGEYINLLIFERVLGSDGATHKASVTDNAAIAALITNITKLTEPEGPTNFQFIYSHTDKTYFLLEVNPRISSSTSLRTAFGVNDAEMCVAYYLKGITPEKATLKSGKAQRYIKDYIEYDGSNL